MHRTLWTTISLGAWSAFLLAGVPSPVLAADIEFNDACAISEHVDLFGSGTEEYKIVAKTVFHQKGLEDGAPNYCGSASMHTPPFGWVDTNLCVTTKGAEIVPFPRSMKVVKSDCKVSDPNAMSVAYSDADFAPWTGSGPANLRGQAFLRTVGGDVKTCAGSDVYLLPATPYVIQLLSRAHPAEVSADPRLAKQFRHSLCDAQGNFSFQELPTGQWFIDTSVKWGVPHIEQPGERPGPLTALLLGIPPPPTTDQQGGELIQQVTLSRGDNLTYLTDRDLR